MKYIDFITLCKSQNWEELKNFLSSDTLDLSTKILASAVISAHHPDQTMREQYGLSVWDDKLIKQPINPSIASFDSLVSVNDFYKAHRIATTGFNKSTPGLNDFFVAEQIKNYVGKNKVILAAALTSPNFSLYDPDSSLIAPYFFNAYKEEITQRFKVYKRKITRSFGNLSISAEDKIAYQKQQSLAKQKKEAAEKHEKDQIELDNKLRSELGQKIEKLLDLKIGSCEVFREQKEPPRNYIGIDGANETKLVKYAVALEDMGVKIDGVQFSLLYGEHLINVKTPPAQTLEDLKKYEELLCKLGQKIEELLHLIKGSCLVFREQKEPPHNYIGMNVANETKLAEYAATLEDIGLKIDGVQFSLKYGAGLINVKTPPTQTLEYLKRCEAKSEVDIVNISSNASPRLFSNVAYANRSNTQKTDLVKTFTVHHK